MKDNVNHSINVVNGEAINADDRETVIFEIFKGKDDKNEQHRHQCDLKSPVVNVQFSYPFSLDWSYAADERTNLTESSLPFMSSACFSEFTSPTTSCTEFTSSASRTGLISSTSSTITLFAPPSAASFTKFTSSAAASLPKFTPSSSITGSELNYRESLIFPSSYNASDNDSTTTTYKDDLPDDHSAGNNSLDKTGKELVDYYCGTDDYGKTTTDNHGEYDSDDYGDHDTDNYIIRNYAAIDKIDNVEEDNVNHSAGTSSDETKDGNDAVSQAEPSYLRQRRPPSTVVQFEIFLSNLCELHTPKGVLYYKFDDGYFFAKCNSYESVTYFKCHIKGCPVRARLIPDGYFAVNCMRHSHCPEYNKIKVEKVRAEIVRRCRSEEIHPRRIYLEEMMNCEYLMNEVPYSSFVRTMQRKRKMRTDSPPKRVFRYSNLPLEDDSQDENENFSPNRGPENLSTAIEYETVNVEDAEIFTEERIIIEHVDVDSNVDTEELSIDSLVEEICVYDYEMKNQETFDVKILTKNDVEFADKVNGGDGSQSETVVGNLCAVCLKTRAIYSCSPCSHFCLCSACKKTYDKSVCPTCGNIYKGLFKTQLLTTLKSRLYHQNDGFFYTKALVRRKKMYLQCHIHSCSVRARTFTSLKCRILQSTLAEHNHPAEPEKMDVNYLNLHYKHRSMKRKTSKNDKTEKKSATRKRCRESTNAKKKASGNQKKCVEQLDETFSFV